MMYTISYLIPKDLGVIGDCQIVNCEKFDVKKVFALYNYLKRIHFSYFYKGIISLLTIPVYQNFVE